MRFSGAKTVCCAGLFWLLLGSTGLAGDEVYSVDGRSVLLYKVINFWYTSLAQDNDMLCGLSLTCDNSGRVTMTHDPETKGMTLGIPNGFGAMLCTGGTVRSTFLDPAYFKDQQPVTASLEQVMNQGIEFSNVSEAEADRLFLLLPDLGFVLTGPVSGLANGRIALGGCPDMIKSCPLSGPVNDLTLDIVRPSSGRRLARFTRPVE